LRPLWVIRRAADGQLHKTQTRVKWKDKKAVRQKPNLSSERTRVGLAHHAAQFHDQPTIFNMNHAKALL
jgi:hypothetical protein